MIKLNFIFHGGLGNQIFQYLASKYISQNFRNINIDYKLSEHIQSGYRNYELNNLLIKPLKTSNLKKRFSEKILNKIIENLIFLNEEYKSKIRFQSNLLNNLYLEERKFRNFYDPLSQLNKDLNSLHFKKRIINIKGFWQNPTCYMSYLENYMSSFIDTRNLIPENIEAGKYITIHIRREDYYLNKNSINKYFSKFSPLKFIVLSLQLIPQDYQNLPIILLSDDFEWKLKIAKILQISTNKKITCIKDSNKFQDWSILRHASINICSNSTFSYSAALLNIENKNSKLRCILPQWINNNETAFERGWLNPEGFIDI